MDELRAEAEAVLLIAAEFAADAGDDDEARQQASAAFAQADALRRRVADGEAALAKYDRRGGLAPGHTPAKYLCAVRVLACGHEFLARERAGGEIALTEKAARLAGSGTCEECLPTREQSARTTRGRNAYAGSTWCIVERVRALEEGE